MQWVSSIAQFFLQSYKPEPLSPISTIGARNFYGNMRRNKNCALPITLATFYFRGVANRRQGRIDRPRRKTSRLTVIAPTPEWGAAASRQGLLVILRRHLQSVALRFVVIDPELRFFPHQQIGDALHRSQRLVLVEVD